MSIEEELLQVVTDQLKKSIHKMDLVYLPHGSGFKLPPEFLHEAWKLIDKDELLTALSNRLKEELVERIVNQFAAEISTDIKQILSVTERREAIRALVRTNFDTIVSIKSE